MLPLALLSVGCKKQPDFGTLPRVEVTLGRESKTASPKPPSGESESQLGSADASSDPPDPRPQRTDEYIYYTLAFEKGEVTIDGVRTVKLAQPASSARRIGRFAFELWIGKELLERIRFDFPLLAAETSNGENAFEGGLSAQTVVKVPSLPRATSARILDRKTRKELEVPWPPSSKVAPERESPRSAPSSSPAEPQSANTSLSSSPSEEEKPSAP